MWQWGNIFMALAVLIFVAIVAELMLLTTRAAEKP